MTNCKKMTTKGKPCKNKVYCDSEFCKLHQTKSEPKENKNQEPKPKKKQKKVSSKCNVILGDGSFKLIPKNKKGKPKSKIIKVRMVTTESQTQFLQMMTDKFKKDYTKLQPFYENGLSTDKLIPVNWTGLPPFENDPSPWGVMDVKVETQEQWDWFMNNTKNHKNSDDTYSVWYPDKPQEKNKNKVWTTNSDPIQTRHPIYILSKGRSSISPSRMTWFNLKKLGLNFKVVVETQEYNEYLKTIPENNLIKLPENLCNLGQGGIPVRNFIWEHSQTLGHTHHWIMDDNLGGFYRLHHNTKLPVESGVYFNMIEDFMDKYNNLYITGLGYSSDNPEIDKSRKSVITNSKIYSCILIRNDLDQILDEKWRGKYNEDVDLVLRVLKKGLPTVGFQSFTCKKEKTGGMVGGNSEIYSGTESNKFDGFQKKVDSLLEQHPDVVKQTNERHTDNRPHHQVDYTPFKQNKLILLPQKKWTINNYPTYCLKDKET